MRIYSWWPRAPQPGNFGDILTPYLIKKITGASPFHINAKGLSAYPNNILAVGSIISAASNGVNVWGSGIMQITDKPNPRATYHAVRGPLTRNRILDNGGDCPEIYGDPALLLPRFYTPTVEKSYRYGIVPHYVDYEVVKAWYSEMPEIKVINILNSSIEEVVDDICQCENVISSSLHGIIAAQAYGVKARWAKFSNKLVGDGSKFKDYFESVGIDMECDVTTTPWTMQEISKKAYVKFSDFDSDKLLHSFPKELL